MLLPSLHNSRIEYICVIFFQQNCLSFPFFRVCKRVPASAGSYNVRGLYQYFVQGEMKDLVSLTLFCLAWKIFWVTLSVLTFTIYNLKKLSVLHRNENNLNQRRSMSMTVRNVSLNSLHYGVKLITLSNCFYWNTDSAFHLCHLQFTYFLLL